MEQWVELKENNGYKLSNLGNVISMPKNNPGTFTSREYKIKSHISNNGYERVSLSKNGKAKRFLLHRLLAIYFIPNPLNKNCVNHKNGIR